MKLTQKAIDKLMNDISLRHRVAITLECSESTVRRWIRENEQSGDLTKFEVVKLLVKETKLSVSELYEK